MQIWYSLVELFPFTWAEPGKLFFFKNALLAVVILTPLFGLLSTMIVNHRMSFFSEALGHGAFTGMVIGVLCGFIQPLWGAMLFSILFSLAVTFIRFRARISVDTVIGACSAVSIALGIFLSTYNGGNFNKLNTLMLGDLYSIAPQEIALLGCIFIITIIYWCLRCNTLTLIALDPSLAASRGIRCVTEQAIFSMLIAIVVTISISWVGMLIINALLVLPAAIARNVSTNMRSYTWVSVTSALACGIGGLLASYYLGSVASACIVLCMGILYGITFILFLVRRAHA